LIHFDNKHDNMKLEGRVAVVTGGASGLGEAAVKRFVKEGCKVVIGDLQEERGKALAQSLGDESKVIFVKTNVTDEASVQNLIDTAVKSFGGLHILVNSAGVLTAGSIISKKCTAKEYTRVFSINVLGTFNVSKAASAVMIKQEPLEGKGERGVIINVASVAGFEGQIGQTIYAGTKGAIIGMTLPMARDLGKFGVRVMTVAPGVYETPMGDQIDKKFHDKYAAEAPLGRLGNPPEFAELCVGIAANTYLTGTVIRVDGGLRLGYL